MELATRQVLKSLVKATCYQKGETVARNKAEVAELFLYSPRNKTEVAEL